MAKRNVIRRSTFRQVRAYYPEGSAPPVIVHGERQLQRNRRPSACYKLFRDPQLALRCARRDMNFYNVLHEAYESLDDARMDTVQVLDAETQPVTHRYVRAWQTRIGRDAKWMEDIEVIAQHTTLGLLLDTGVADIVRCFEAILDQHYLSYHAYIERRIQEFECFFGYTLEYATSQAFLELISCLYHAGHLVNERLGESCVAPRQLDVVATCLN